MTLDVIHNCDCLSGLREMSAECIDLTVTSPPYDNLRKYKGFTFDFHGIAHELYRVTKAGGVVVWVVADATINGSESCTSFQQALYFKDVCGFNLHDTMIWHKIPGAPFTNPRYEQHFEYMFVLSKGHLSTFNGIKDKLNVSAGRAIDGTRRPDNPSGKRRKLSANNVATLGLRGNVWSICTANGHERVGHPAQFPESLVRDHILSWSNEGDVVLDPFMGSGTTAKVATELNRRYIGFEVSKEYCELAEKRIASNGSSLFSSAAAMAIA